jgi:hypothetical protein
MTPCELPWLLLLSLRNSECAGFSVGHWRVRFTVCLGRPLMWGDILGVLRLNAGKLDLELLHRSAAELGVLDLLDRALVE